VKRQTSRTHWFGWEGAIPRFGKLEEFTSDHGVSTFTHDDQEYDLVGLLIDAALLPTQQFQVSDLTWIFEYDTPDPSRSIDRVDLDAPILVAHSKEGKLTVIDGMHRLAKAVKLGHETIKGIYIGADLLAKHKLNESAEARPVVVEKPGYPGGPVRVQGSSHARVEESTMNSYENLMREAQDFAKGASTFGANPTKAFNNQSQKQSPQAKVKAVIDTALKKTAMQPYESLVREAQEFVNAKSSD
jgi:hypothetical protein